MPQPLSRVASGANIILASSGDSPLEHRPKLAPLLAEVIASWATVEAFMLALFVEMMGGSAHKAATVFLALDIQSAKSAAISAIASTLPKGHQELLGAVMSYSKSCEIERNAMAHGVWGYSPDLPDSLLLCHQKRLISPDLNASDVRVYRKQDFDAAIQRNQRAIKFCSLLHDIFRGSVSNKDGQLYHQLCSEPEIRERLDRQALKAQANAQAQQQPPSPQPPSS